AVGLAGAKVVRLGAAWPPSAALLRPALLEEEGKTLCSPLLVEEGWREATGWWGLKRRGGVARAPQDHRPRHCRVLPSFTGGQNQTPSPPRRGGVARSDGVVGFETPQATTVRDTAASCPPSQEGKIKSFRM